MPQRGIALAALLTSFACGCSGRSDATVIQAFYAAKLFTATYRELPGAPTANEAYSVLYESDAGVAGGAPFVSVLSAIGENNPVWHEVQVSGNQCASDEACAVPVQLMSEEDILSAVGTGPDQVHLVPTGIRCSVVGVKPAGS